MNKENKRFKESLVSITLIPELIWCSFLRNRCKSANTINKMMILAFVCNFLCPSSFFWTYTEWAGHLILSTPAGRDFVWPAQHWLALLTTIAFHQWPCHALLVFKLPGQDIKSNWFCLFLTMWHMVSCSSLLPPSPITINGGASSQEDFIAWLPHAGVIPLGLMDPWNQACVLFMTSHIPLPQQIPDPLWTLGWC